MKAFAFDVETTGLDVDLHDIHELSYKIFDGETELVSRKLFMRPNNPDNIVDEALAICGLNKETVMKYPLSMEAFKILFADLEEHIDKFDTTDKFVFLGYNVDFDGKFLKVFTEEHSKVLGIDFRYGSYFLWKKNEASLDVYRSLPMYVYEFGIYLENYKLETVCKFFGIELSKAHDSMHDLVATIELTYKMRHSMSWIPTDGSVFLNYEELVEIANEASDDESKLKAFEAIKEALVARDNS